MGLFTRVFRPDSILTDSDRETALLIIGQPGVGKSWYMESLAWQDIAAGHGVGFVDVAGDAAKRLINRLATMPAVHDRVIVLDPTNRDYVVRINPLAAFNGMEPERIALFVRDIVIRLWKVDSTQAPRMVWVMTNAFVAMSALGLTFDDLQAFLLNKAYRDEQLVLLPSRLGAVRTFFGLEYPKTLPGARMWAAPILNKLGALVFDPDLRLMVSGSPGLDFRQVIDRGHILVAHLPKGVLGEDAANLLAALVVAQYQKAAMSREDTHQRPRYYLYLDEFQNYSTDNIRTILDESRKYQLSLVLAHQYLEQLTPVIKSSVLNTSGQIAAMRVGYGDAKELAPYIFPREDYFTKSETRFGTHSVGRLISLSVDDRQRPLGWDGLAQVISNQEKRRLWFRRKGATNPLSLRTPDLPKLAATTEHIARLLEHCGQRYGVNRAQALAELMSRQAARQQAESKKKSRSKSKANSKTTQTAKPT